MSRLAEHRFDGPYARRFRAAGAEERPPAATSSRPVTGPTGQALSIGGGRRHEGRRRRWGQVATVILTALLTVATVGAGPSFAAPAQPPSSVVNGGFETGDLSGWTATGSAFAGGVTSDAGWGWGCCFGQQGRYHVWGFKAGGDGRTGTLTSSVFRVPAGGELRLLVGGGADAERLYVALVRARDGAVLLKATGTDTETYRRVAWDASGHAGEDVRIRVVDEATGGWGHINLDDVQVTRAPAPEAAVIAHWPFDEGQGRTTAEVRTQRADPIAYVFNDARFKPSSDPLWLDGGEAAGVLAGALDFDGYSTWVTHPGFSAPTSGLTVEAWVAPRAFEWGDEGKLSAIVNQHDQGAGRGFMLGVGRHGNWSFQAGVNGSWQTVWAEPEASLQRGRWAHVAATYSAGGRAMRLYLNGRLVGSRETPAGELTPAVGDLLIGRHNQPVFVNATFPVNMFNGAIDEVKIRSRPLAAHEVAAAYDAAIGTFAGRTVPAPDLFTRRSRYAGDRYRPKFHFMAPWHWMNEPHAPLHANGQFHLFYQHNQHGPYWHNMSWGHAVSPDMVHWRDLPVALVPEANSVAPDGVWSGSAALDAAGNPLLFFTAGDDSSFPNQRTGVARCVGSPCDRDLTSWRMDPHPVTVQSPDLDVGPGRKVRFGEFRDPFVWREGGNWFQLVTSGVETVDGADVGGTVLLYTSTDAVDWTYVRPLLVGDIRAYPRTGQIWELPVFLPIRDGEGRRKHVLFVNPAWKHFTQHNAKYVWYWVGTWDPQSMRFKPDHDDPRRLDYGEHFTGPSGFVDPRGRSILFGIAQDRRTERAHHDAGWAHNAGLPIELRLRDDGDLGIRPLPELASLHTTASPLVAVTGDTDLDRVNDRVAGVRGDGLHIRLEMASGSATRYGLSVRRSPGGAEETTVFHDRSAGTINVDRTRSGSVSSLTPDLGIQGGPLPLRGETLKLDVFVDKSMIEVYANGHKSLTTRCYPSRDDALGIRAWADGRAVIKSLEVWAMGSAYEG